MSRLEELRARKLELKEAAKPLRKLLRECDKKPELLIAAEQSFKAAQERYDDSVAERDIYGRLVDIDPLPLNLAEMHVKQARAGARAAARERPNIEGRLTPIEDALKGVAAELEEAEAVEHSEKYAPSFAKYDAADMVCVECLKEIDKGIEHAKALASQHANGRVTEQTPWWYSALRLQAARGVLTSRVSRSDAPGLSRWAPKSTVLEDGSKHLNLASPESALPSSPDGGLRNPAIAALEEQEARQRALGGSGDGLPEWLDGKGGTFMPSPRVG